MRSLFHAQLTRDQAAIVQMGNYIGPPADRSSADDSAVVTDKKKKEAAKQTTMGTLLRVIFKRAFLHSVVGPRNKTWTFGDSFMVSAGLN